MRYLFLLASGRLNGNSELLARYAAQHLPEDASAVFLRLSDYPLPYFKDYRRGDYGGLVPTDNERKLIDETLLADVLVMVSPLYWYSLAASAKLYLDYWSTWMRLPGLNFRDACKGKRVFGICAMAGTDSAEARPLEEQIRLSANYMAMDYRRTLVVQANEAGDVLDDEDALGAAARLFTDGQ